MDKRALSRAYRDTARPMGIYSIRNVQNGKALVRSSVDLPSSINRERTQLRFGGHRNVALQQDWNALGADAFVFEVIDTFEPPKDSPAYDPSRDLAALEQLWLDKLQPFDDRGYMTRPRSR